MHSDMDPRVSSNCSTPSIHSFCLQHTLNSFVLPAARCPRSPWKALSEMTYPMRPTAEHRPLNEAMSCYLEHPLRALGEVPAAWEHTLVDLQHLYDSLIKCVLCLRAVCTLSVSADSLCLRAVSTFYICADNLCLLQRQAA